MTISKLQVLDLYRKLLRSAKNIAHYNFREHAIRRVRYEFLENRGINAEQVKGKYEWGIDQLKMLRRLESMSNLYHSENSVILEKLR